MKIALIDPSLFTWPYDHALAAGIHENGHDIILYTKHLSTKEQGKGDAYIQEIFYPGFQTKFMKSLPQKLFLILKGLSHIVSMAQLWFILKKSRPDAIHFQWTPLAIIDQFFIPAFRSIAPTILTVHDSSPFNNNPSAALQRVGAIKIMNAFDHLIVHTEKAKTALIGYGLPATKISLIPHGILDSYPTVHKSEQSLQKSSNAAVTLLLFGQIKPYKGTDLLIKALAELPPPLLSQCHLQIVGKPQMEMEPLFELAKEKGVDKNITWDLRFINEDEIPALFSAADIMVMPYREIDASGVLMVALSVGRPIVASNIGLFAELLQDQVHGALVPVEDIGALSKALAHLIENKPARDQMGENVLSLRNSIPDWKEIGKRTVSLYLRISN